MKRRATTGDEAGKAQRRKTANPKRKTAPAVVSHSRTSDADLQKQLHRRTSELAEARKQLAGAAKDKRKTSEALRQRINELNEVLQQQSATADVLKIMSQSEINLPTVLDTLTESAARLCRADRANIARVMGTHLQFIAFSRVSPEYRDFMTNLSPKIDRGSLSGRAILERTIVHVADALADPEFKMFEAQKRGNFRTGLAVPLFREEVPIGVFFLMRQTVEPFTEQQIELVTTFANQAVIAIENTRLLNELRQRTDDLTESLEQQTAISTVLGVISSSAGDLKPIFQSLLENAIRICGAKFGNLWLREGDLFRVVAAHGVSVAYREMLFRASIRPGPDTGLGMLLKTKRFVQIDDITKGKAYLDRDPLRVATVELGGGRTLAEVPLLRDGELIGSINIYHQEVKPFTEKQIELLTTFAAQAVIAIESTRLLNELRQRTDELSESLEQQTATSEVLQVISSSPDDVQPVFQAMLQNATHICEANYGMLFRFVDGEVRAAAMVGVPPEFAQFWRAGQKPSGRTAIGRAAETMQTVHIVDVTTEPAYVESEPVFVAAVNLGGFRTILVVPMIKDDKLIGLIAIYRKEVRPFSDKQIDLVRNFAAQAVIAIENARLLNELRQRTDDLSEALEQQTATSEVLKVISSSPGELEPVFETMVAKATELCGASFGTLWLREGDAFRPSALHGALPPAWIEQWRSGMLYRPGPGRPLARMIEARGPIQVPDMTADVSYLERDPLPVAAVEVAGVRTLLAVPMIKDEDLVGCIAIYRREVRPFTEKQIELVKNFAAQAVIAIENTRLLSELRESLQQQTATADVLKVISSSTGELEPVFNTMLANAVRICEAKFGVLFRFEDGAWSAAAMFGVPPAFAEFWHRGPQRPGPRTALGRVVETRRTVHIVDVMTEQAYVEGEPVFVAAVNLGRFRAILNVPMLRENELIGAFAIYRQDVGAFSEGQIELVQNFASQAVIAIENARLLNELRESLQQQTATADVLKVISRSTFDLQTVLQTLVKSAAALCVADKVTIIREKDGGLYRAEAYGFSREFMDYVKDIPIEIERGSAAGRALLEGRSVHIPDVKVDPDYTLVETQKLGDYRTILSVPMLRESVPIGVLVLTRSEVRPFTDKQIELASTFADQAAIAIENVRLFESVEARTRELSKSLEDLRTAQDRLIQTEKLASLGQLTAGIAHEIKNPLNFVNNFSAVSVELIDELRQALSGAHLDSKLHAEISEIADMLQGNLDKVMQHGKRADSIVKNMLLHSRQGSSEHRPVAINALVEEGLNLAYHGARAEKQGFNIALERSFDPAAGEVDVFPQEITRVLLNLISNGFYAVTKQKEAGDESYEPTLAAATKDLGDRVEIRIRDNGTGIPPEVKDKMFNPFFTTKPAGEGTGLGLSISHDIIVKQHSGSIEVDTQAGQFTEFRIILPRTAASIAKSGGRA